MVRLIGRHGAMTIAQVMRAMGTQKTVAYRHFRRCEEARLVERLSIPGVGPVLHATREGIRYGGLPLPVAAVSAGTIEHTLRCTSVAIRAGEHYGHEAILTEREIVAAEALEERPIASVPVGSYSGAPRKHRADIAVLREEGTIAIEVELTPKSRRRLEAIIGAWCAAALGDGELAQVHYLCAPGQTLNAVRRAVENVGAGSVVVVAEVKERWR
jgi:AcrR family transcriptional regulator